MVLRERTKWLTVYDMGDAEDGILSLIDKVALEDVPWPGHPRVDGSHRVYVPCGMFGVWIYRCQNGCLRLDSGPLECVRDARCVCVNTADTVFLGDWDTKSVCLVNVSSDIVIRRLEKPAQVRGLPLYMSVLGPTVLVCYKEKVSTLVTYRSDSLNPGRVLQRPEDSIITSITTDSHSSSVLITGWYGYVYVLDDKLIWHRIYTGDRGLMECDVVQSQLWLGYENGDIAVLTSR